MRTVKVEKVTVETVELIAGKDYGPEDLRLGASGRSKFLTPAAQNRLLGKSRPGLRIVSYPEGKGRIYAAKWTIEELTGGTDK